MDTITIIYGICLLVGVIYTVAAFLLGSFADFGGHDGDMGGPAGEFSHDYGVDTGGSGSALGSTAVGGEVLFGPFSPLVIAFFLTCFGGVGILVTIAWNLPPLISLPIAAVSGFLLAWLLTLMFNRLLGGMASSSEVRLNTLVGTDAEVTVAIPPIGVGEIAYIAMGSRYVTPARSDEQSPIPRYATVRITRIVGNTFFVRPAVEEQLRDLGDAPQPVESVAARESTE
jgi:membrane protein implicated in regulation of membrane protease activity